MTVDDVLAYPHQIGDALWRIEAAGLPRASGVEVCGVDHGAREAAAEILGTREPGSRPLVLCISYSGDDAEALECFEQAGERGAPRAVVCTAGRLAARAREEGVPVVGVPAGFDDPRAAIVYFVLAAVMAADPSLKADLEAAAPALERLAESPGEGVPETRNRAEKVLAERFLEDLAGASKP